MEWWCGVLGLRAGVRHGDTPQSERRKQVLHPPDLLITTPESLQALFMGKRLRKALAGVRHVIVDEIHELAGSKRGAQLSVALERLTRYAGEFQRVGLSATVGNPQEIARFLCSDRPCRIVEIPVTPFLEIGVRYAGEEFRGQARAVGECLDRFPSTLVFVNTRVTAEVLTGMRCRISPERLNRRLDTSFQAPPLPDFCPFCPGGIDTATPTFSDGKRIAIGNSTTFPNLFPFAQWHTVTVLTRDHYQEKFSHSDLRDGFLGQIASLKRG